MGARSRRDSSTPTITARSAARRSAAAACRVSLRTGDPRRRHQAHLRRRRAVAGAGRRGAAVAIRRPAQAARRRHRGRMELELGGRVPGLASRPVGHRHGHLPRSFRGAPRGHGQYRARRDRRRDRGDGGGRPSRGAADARPVDRARLQPRRLLRPARAHRAGARVQRGQTRRAVSPFALGERRHHRQRQGSGGSRGRRRRRLLQRALQDRRGAELRSHRRAGEHSRRRLFAHPDDGEHVSLHRRLDHRRRDLSARDARGRARGVPRRPSRPGAARQDDREDAHRLRRAGTISSTSAAGCRASRSPG